MATTIKGTLFHPEHPLKIDYYGEGSTYSCAACELRITGFSQGLPGSIAVARHPGHQLSLRRLRASCWCNVCWETSHAGAYMYTCAACNYGVHPRWRCRFHADAAQPADRGDARRRLAEKVLHHTPHIIHTSEVATHAVLHMVKHGACTIM